MKQSRRKELKTNELSVYLNQLYEAAQRNASYLIGGVVVVVVVLVVGLLVQRSRHRAEADAWNSYNTIRRGDVTTDPALLDNVQTLVAEYGDHADLGPLVLELQGRLAHQLALSMSEDENKQERVRLLKQARDAYRQELDTFGERLDIGDRVRMSLAAVEESLYVEGESEIDTIRQLYGDVVDRDDSPFRETAQGLLDELETRLSPVELVATRPAETPITTRPTVREATPEEVERLLPSGPETEVPVEPDVDDIGSSEPQPEVLEPGPDTTEPETAEPDIDAETSEIEPPATAPAG